MQYQCCLQGRVVLLKVHAHDSSKLRGMAPEHRLTSMESVSMSSTYQCQCHPKHNVLACCAAVVEQHEFECKVGREDVAMLVHELLGGCCLERVVHEVHKDAWALQNIVNAEDLKACVCLGCDLLPEEKLRMRGVLAVAATEVEVLCSVAEWAACELLHATVAVPSSSSVRLLID